MKKQEKEKKKRKQKRREPNTKRLYYAKNEEKWSNEIKRKEKRGYNK